MIKLVVSDMDGTLLNKKSGISLKNAKAIQKLQEHHIEFAIASGRDYDGVYSIMSQYNIDCEAILGNGAQYVDKNGQIIISCYMNKDIIKAVLKIFFDMNIPYMIYTTKGIYTDYETEYVRNAFIQRAIIRFHDSIEEFEEKGRNSKMPCNFLKKIDNLDEFLKQDLEIIKIEAFSLNIDDIKPAKALLKDIPMISYLSSFEDNVEVTDENAQKGYILEEVIKLKGLKKEEVAVVGDGMNDLSMFECFSYSYAPSNADPYIASLAYKGVSACVDDGFSEAVDDILSIE